MTATLQGMAAKKKQEQSPEELAAAELVRQARERGVSLTGPDGLLKQLSKTVIETALNEEMTEHLGYAKHDPAGAGAGNIRNGTRAKTVLTGAQRPGRDRHTARSGWHVRAADRAQAAAPAERGRRGGAVAVCQGSDDR